MKTTARRVALAVSMSLECCFLPFLKGFASGVVTFAGDPGMAVAWAQLIFNVVMVTAVLFMLRLFRRQLESLGTTSRIP